MKEESNSFPISDIGSRQAIGDLTMMLLYLSKFSELDRFSDRNDYYAWKGYPFGMLNELAEKDYIRQEIIRPEVNLFTLPRMDWNMLRHC